LRTFLGWRIAAAATVLVAAMLLDQPEAHAGIDASGAWRISEFGMGFIEVWQQTGSSLMASGFSGTIDSATGAFSLTGDSPTCPVAGDTFSGAVAPDGLTLTGTLTFHGTFDCCFSMACGSSVFGSRCGNGVLGAGEQCDDGLATGTPGDCCTAACQFQPGGTACADSTNLCAPSGVCDGVGGCTLSYEPATTCAEAAPRGATLQMVSQPDSAPDKVTFKWKKGPAVALGDFGMPLGGTSYELCIYDEAGGVPFNAYQGRPSGMCGTAPCWTSSSTGWKFKSKTGAPDGITNVVLKAGAAGKAKVQVSAGKLDLALSPFPLQKSPRVVAPVRSSTGQCWGASFSTATKNTTTKFTAKSD
jgi:hypothetical protein